MAVTDNSGSVTLTSNYQPGDAFPIGETYVVYTATDPSGNLMTLMFTLTVQGMFLLTIVSCAYFLMGFFFFQLLFRLVRLIKYIKIMGIATPSLPRRDENDGYTQIG